jgi:dTDP-4-dehydrorhamnose 3,5-epimerase
VDIEPLGVPGTWLVTPSRHDDNRGTFFEWYRGDRLEKVAGRSLSLAQANCSVSRRGVLRGIHFADVPPGQAKYVTCLAGCVLDVVVDLRLGSPTFGRWDAVELAEVGQRAVYLAEGMGHAFLTLSERATVAYLCSATYAPAREHGVHPLDPDLGIVWPTDVEAVLSPKDASSPGLAETRVRGLLPTYDACLEFYSVVRAANST